MTTEHVSVPRELIEELEEIAQALFERERSETPYWSRHFGEELKAAISRGTSSQHRMANDDMVNAASLAYNDSIEQTHDGFDLPWCDEDAMRAALAAILSRATPSDESAELIYAKKLAMVLWERHYKDVAPDFDTLDDLYGVLSQIDNMLTGLVREKPSAPRVVTAQMVKRAVRAYDESTGDSWPGCVEQSIRYALVAALSSMDDFPECSGNSNDCPENEGYGCCQSGVVARMQDAMKESRSDTERLDWLALHPRAAKIMVNGESKECIFWGISSSPEHTLREAIDAAAAPQAGERG